MILSESMKISQRFNQGFKLTFLESVEMELWAKTCGEMVWTDLKNSRSRSNLFTCNELFGQISVWYKCFLMLHLLNKGKEMK